MMKFIVLFTIALCTLMLDAQSQTMPQAGEKAPDFSLQAQDGKTYSLADFHGKYIVFYFYPEDDTPGCTKEACNFRDDLSELTKHGAEIIGVSVDDVASHQKFAEKYHLNFLLLADTQKAISLKYGVLRPSGYAGRATFLIDGEGKIAKVYPAVNPTLHAKEILADLEALKK